MALPHDEDIQEALLQLLAAAKGGRMHCRDIYTSLAKQFPKLTQDETTLRYRNSLSHWANRVQFARLHLIKKRLFLSSTMSGGRNYWAISETGLSAIKERAALANKLLAELEAL